MTYDLKEEGAGVYPSRAWAERVAKQMQAQGRETKVEESQFHHGMFVIYATPKPEDIASE